METKSFQILSLASHNIKTSFRNRSLPILSLTAVLLVFTVNILSTMTVGGHDRIIQNGNLWIMGITGLIAGLYFSLNIISSELKNKTFYLILSRNVSKNAFITGKFVGICINLFILFIFLSCLYFFQLVFLTEIEITVVHFTTLFFIFCEWIILSSFALLFACFTNPFIHSFLLACLYFIGHWSRYIYIFSKNTNDVFLKKTLSFFYYVFPNLEVLNYKYNVIYNEAINSSDIILSVFTALFWTLAAYASTLILFNLRKNF